MLLKKILNRGNVKTWRSLRTFVRLKSSDENETFQISLRLAQRLETLEKESSPKYFRLKEIQTELVRLTNDYKDNESLSNDEDFAHEAELDNEKIEVELQELMLASARLLDKSQKFAANDAYLEVNSGAGGVEAGIFAGEILNLYKGYANYLGFSVYTEELESTTVLDTTSILNAKLSVQGVNVYKALKYECGVHRVQRVPITGAKTARLQTSTCSVAVYPKPNIEDVVIKPTDIEITWTRATGPGGQNRDKSETKCNIKYLPTGERVSSQQERKQKQNQEIAMARLKEKLYLESFNEVMKNMNQARKSQIGNMDRNEKIRSYNFNRNQIADHRLREVKTVKDMTNFLQGAYGFEELDDLHNKLDEIELTEFLKSYLEMK